MHASLLSLWISISLTTAPTETRFAQVAPHYHVAATAMERSTDEDCAVVLIQGLCVHPFSSDNANRAIWQRWQKPGSELVRTLAQQSDVYGVAYSQNVAVEEVAVSAELASGIDRLKELGYSQIVLVGHSAGGLVARQFVEDFPQAGVTKVIQVCSPNGGSCWGDAQLGVCKKQEVFLASLSHEGREGCLARRTEKKIPHHVEFVCLVGQMEVHFRMNMSFELWEGAVINVAANKEVRGDGIVSSSRQWTHDLQQQGIPAVALPVCHLQVMRNDRAIEKIAELVREQQPRLSSDEVEALRQEVLGNE